MQIWMDVMRDLEHVMDDHERLFDAWAEGGVTGLVIGPLEFDTPRLLPGVKWEASRGTAATTFDRVPPRTTPTFTVMPEPDPLSECSRSVWRASSRIALAPFSGSRPACAAFPSTLSA